MCTRLSAPFFVLGPDIPSLRSDTTEDIYFFRVTEHASLPRQKTDNIKVHFFQSMTS
jgi:hypothetical protein